jgi:uncharacterized protein (DUF433 family)
MPKTEYRIVSGEDSEIHDESHIEGRHLTVRTIHSGVDGRGLDPQTVADRHEVDVADVYRALRTTTTIPKRCPKLGAVDKRRVRSTTMSR